MADFFSPSSSPTTPDDGVPPSLFVTPEIGSVVEVSALSTVINEFSSAVDAAGLRFLGANAELPRALLASLVAKRFAILTGLSGSGKTLLARAVGQWLGADENGGKRYLVVPVRPDWTSPEPLLGYEDALLPPSMDGRRAWFVPEVLRFILEASRDPERLWLLVLDEMNLAYVERYFADVLSGLESGEAVLPNLRLDHDGYWRIPVGGEPKVALPANLLIVGTVNVDETTYQFSPKVLDRAFSFEFRVASSELDGEARRPTEAAPTSKGHHTTLLVACADDDLHIDHPLSSAHTIAEQLRDLHEQLSPIGFEFGHRTFFEAGRFAWLLDAAGIADPDVALDWIVMTKILPRLHGSRRQLETFLEDLVVTSTGPDPDKPVMPLTARKASRMLELVRANQFVSFAE
jgi:5-methylcytosine-specific restriction protein B